MARLLSVAEFRDRYRNFELTETFDVLVGTQLAFVTHELERVLRTKFGAVAGERQVFYWDGNVPPAVGALSLNLRAAFVSPNSVRVVLGSTAQEVTLRSISGDSGVAPEDMNVSYEEGLVHLFPPQIKRGFYAVTLDYGFALPVDPDPPAPPAEPVWIDIPTWLKDVAAAWTYQLVMAFVNPELKSSVMDIRIDALVADHARSYPLALKPLLVVPPGG